MSLPHWTAHVELHTSMQSIHPVGWIMKVMTDLIFGTQGLLTLHYFHHALNGKQLYKVCTFSGAREQVLYFAHLYVHIPCRTCVKLLQQPFKMSCE